MNKQQLINEIYRNVPDYSTGINGNGEHIIEFSQKRMLVRANLERLSFEKLQSLALMLKIQSVFVQVAETA